MKKNITWTYERCYEAAKACETKKDFYEKSPKAYNAACYHKWLDDYDWLVGRGYWTYERCYEEAKKYETSKDFSDNSKTAYLIARREGWLMDYDWLDVRKPEGYWNVKENCIEEAQKYETRTEFRSKNQTAYNYTRKNGWLDDCTNLLSESETRSRAKKGKIYWNYDKCFAAASECSSRNDFRKKYSGAYYLAYNSGGLDDYQLFKTPEKKQHTEVDYVIYS